MRRTKLLEFTDKGIYCSEGDFYIDPWKPVPRALITHAHSDHARWGNQYYLAHKLSEHILKLRLGNEINLQTIEYGESISINRTKVSFHPAGHMIGSSQIRIECNGEVWVVSGDYKTEYDGVCTPFEPVQCHAFITESTFGMPVYHWRPQQELFDEINSWWNKNKEEGKTTIIAGYSLGKAQRVLKNIDHTIGKVYMHGAIASSHDALLQSGVDLPDAVKIDASVSKKDLTGNLILCPPSALNSAWMRKFYPYSTGYCSGWMSLRGAKNRSAVDRGFAISDHADWQGLNDVVKATQAEVVYVTHGYSSIFSRWLNETGVESYEVQTLYGNEEEDVIPEENKTEGTKE